MQDAMNSAVHRVITQMFFSNADSGSISQFLDIHVSRDNIVGDTLRELSEHPESDLKKPLRVCDAVLVTAASVSGAVSHSTYCLLSLGSFSGRRSGRCGRRAKRILHVGSQRHSRSEVRNVPIVRGDEHDLVQHGLF